MVDYYRSKSIIVHFRSNRNAAISIH